MRAWPLVLVLPALACGCHRDERFESVCQIVSKSVVEVDEHGEAIQIDIMLEWNPYPGTQFQMIRGGKEFAECIESIRWATTST